MSDLIPRLLVARTTGHAPPGLIDAVLEQLPVGKPAAECRAMRDSFAVATVVGEGFPRTRG